MEKRFVVYVHLVPNGKKYIGITCKKPERRWNNGKGYEKNLHFYNAILKYGWDNIQHIILYEDLTKEEACALEQELIKKFKTTDDRYGYNHSIGGEAGGLGVVFSEERRRKLSKAFKGKKHSDESRKKMSEGHKGLTTWNKGRHWTESEKETMRKAQERMKPVICIETNIIYYGTRDASEKTGINRSSIKDCCNHRRHCKSAGGFHWEFVER